MKKILTIAIVGISFASQAQPVKGTFLAGGTVNYLSVSSSQANSSRYLNFTPQFGFFTGARSAFGAGLIYQYQKQSGINVPNAVSGLVFHRWYVPILEKFYFVLQSSVAYGVEPADIFTSFSSQGKQHTLLVDVAPRFVFFPTQHWGIELSLLDANFKHSTFDLDPIGHVKENKFNAYGPSASLTLFYYFHFPKN